MGAIAEAIVAYTQPLVDGTDGSLEQVETALGIGQVCWNVAILSEEDRRSYMDSLGESLGLDEEELEDFWQSMLLPMIRRHEEMFPQMHQRESMELPHWESSLSPLPSAKSAKGKSQAPGRYEPCPCNSGRKYKFCCGGRGARAY